MPRDNVYSQWFTYGRPVQPGEFLNRETELRTVLNRLRNGDSTNIVGESHIGKTSFLLKLADEKTRRDFLGNDADCLMISSMDLHPIDSSFTPASFWEDALEPVRMRAEHRASHHRKRLMPARYPRRLLRRLFNNLAAQGLRLVLLMDEFERLLLHPNFQDPSFFPFLRSLAKSGALVLVPASRWSVAEMNERGRELLDTGSPFFNFMIDVHLCPFDERTAGALLNRAGNDLSTIDRRFIRRVAGLHPYLLQAMIATFLDTRGRDRQARAAEAFYQRISSHFDDLWYNMDDQLRTTAVILSLVEMGGRALGHSFSYGEIQRTDAFGPELKKLARLGVAEKVSDRWQVDRERLLVWRGEQWTVGMEAFTWWVRDVVIAETRHLAAYDAWLTHKRYRLILTQEQWEKLVGAARQTPDWIMRGVGTLAHALLEELMGL